MALHDAAQLALVDTGRGEHGEDALCADRPDEHEAGIVVDHELVQAAPATHRHELLRKADGRGEHGGMRRFIGHRGAEGHTESVD